MQEETVDDFVSIKASGFNKSQQHSTSSLQQVPPRPINRFQPRHHLTINVTGILAGCTLELELVAVTVIVKVPGGVPGGGGGGAEPPPQPMQSSTANAPAAKTHRGMCLLDLS
jgi:hypothetical protein